MKWYPLSVQPHKVSSPTWEMDLQKSCPWHDAECAICGCQMEVRFHGLALSVQQQKLNIAFFIIIIIPGKMKLLISGTHKQGGKLDVLFYTKYSVAGRTVSYLFVLLSAFRACVQKPWMAIKHTHLKKTKKHWTHYNTRTVAHSFGSNNYNLTAVINFAYRRWFLFWLQLYRKVELWESIISLAVLDINTLAASSTATLHFVKNSTHELESTAAALKCTL